MPLFRPCFSFYLLATSLIAAASPPPSITCPVVLPRASHQRVIGGIPVVSTTQSYLVSLSNPNNTFVCSGSLLSSRWVLTAAHCDVTVKWRVRLATSSATSGSHVPIFRVINHPSYIIGRVDSPGDMALIQLAADAPSDTSFVSINVNASLPISGSFARTSGYGRTTVNSATRNPKPNQVDAPVNSPIRCRQIYKGYLNIRQDLFICAGYGKNSCHADSCNGDSGGPLVQYNQHGRPVQIGITSFGLRCGDNGVPGVYIRLSSYIQWMAQNGAEFTTSSSVSSTFAAGSSEAAKDQPSATIQESQIGDLPGFSRRKNTLVISTVWFAVICVIAGISLISLIGLSFAFLFGGRRESATSPSEFQSPAIDTAPSLPPFHRHAAGTQQHKDVQRAIDILQSVINDDMSQPSRNSTPSEFEDNVFAPSVHAEQFSIRPARPPVQLPAPPSNMTS
ncbi:unnamed protein product [Agarophyton chilense]